MTDDRMTKEAAATLAAFIHQVRPDWHTAGVMHALGNARLMGTATDLAIAALAAAANPTNRTPAVIAMEGPHWGHTQVKRKASANTTPKRTATCAICYLGHDECRARWGHDHEFESVADAAKRSIAAADRPTAASPPRMAKRLGDRDIEDVELP